jgi:hypothetical protein
MPQPYYRFSLIGCGYSKDHIIFVNNLGGLRTAWRSPLGELLSGVVHFLKKFFQISFSSEVTDLDLLKNRPRSTKNCAEILPSIPSMTYRESGASVNDGQLNCLVRSQRICRYRSSPVSLQPQYRNLRNRGAGGWRVTVSVSSYACYFDVVPGA